MTALDYYERQLRRFQLLSEANGEFRTVERATVNADPISFGLAEAMELESLRRELPTLGFGGHD